MKKTLLYIFLLVILVVAYVTVANTHFSFSFRQTQGAVASTNATSSADSSKNTIVDTYASSSPVANALAQGSVPSGGMISIDFDDGWQDQYDNALPILRSEGIPATFYIITGTLVPGAYQHYMTANEVFALSKDGEEIGAHTVTHPYLAQISQAKAKQQILDSKSKLEKLINKPVLTLAYPYGSWDPHVAQIVKNDGFIGARTATHGSNGNGSNLYELNSFSVEDNTSLAQVKAIVDRAKQNNTWEIIAFHQIEKNGTQYATTPEFLKEVLDYIKSSGVPVVTESEGMKKISQ
jgi:peptidoglycan/xylan/chitin deacetylase (PgdA/CDA1 family)